MPAALYPLVAAALTRDAAQRPGAASLAGQGARLDLAAAAPVWHAAGAADAGIAGTTGGGFGGFGGLGGGGEGRGRRGGAGGGRRGPRGRAAAGHRAAVASPA